jgi:hypothetical protein
VICANLTAVLKRSGASIVVRNVIMIPVRLVLS